jgi:hypothetical protein
MYHYFKSVDRLQANRRPAMLRLLSPNLLHEPEITVYSSGAVPPHSRISSMTSSAAWTPPHAQNPARRWRCTARGIRGESEAREGARGPRQNAPERKPTEELHGQRWKARARSTPRRWPTRAPWAPRPCATPHASPSAKRAAPTLRSEEEKQVGGNWVGWVGAIAYICFASPLLLQSDGGRPHLLDKETYCFCWLIFCKIHWTRKRTAFTN